MLFLGDEKLKVADMSFPTKKIVVQFPTLK